jgi:hypothetical protein
MPNNNIPGGYFFPYWGPLIFRTKLTRPDLCRFIDKKYHIKSVKDKLAGVVDEEFAVSPVEFMKDIEPALDLYRKAHHQYYREDIKDLKCISSWVNFMRAGDCNPIHFHHDCKLSCVLYLKIPKKLKKENADYVGRSVGPGGIVFHYGEPRDDSITQYSLFPEERDLLIFPSNVRHEVIPFKSKGIKRISVAANLK